MSYSPTIDESRYSKPFLPQANNIANMPYLRVYGGQDSLVARRWRQSVRLAPLLTAATGNIVPPESDPTAIQAGLDAFTNVAADATTNVEADIQGFFGAQPLAPQAHSTAPAKSPELAESTAHDLEIATCLAGLAGQLRPDARRDDFTLAA